MSVDTLPPRQGIMYFSKCNDAQPIEPGEGTTYVRARGGPEV